MERDFTKFPANEDGEALWVIAQNGTDLSQSREVDFSVLMPTPDAAIELAIQILRCEEKVSCTRDPDNKEFPMDVQVHPCIVPTYSNIADWQRELSKLAAPLGGELAGWGFKA